MSRVLSLLTIVATAMWLTTGAATAARAADMELGRYLATECLTCHRAATPDGAIPNIFGVAETNLTEVIKAYRAKRLPNAVMQNIAARLTDEEIAALALYFSRTPKP
jgi:cytochrome c553